MMNITINDISYDLAGLEQLAWKYLVNGSLRSKDGFHTVCVGTVNEAGEATLRTVINRKVSEGQKKYLFILTFAHENLNICKKTTVCLCCFMMHI
jgi:hypothetical protein